MQDIQAAKQLISGAKNIYIIPNDNNEPEPAAASLALFYSLRDLSKNVNLVIENLPEKIKFLTPSLDFISFPKNFIISVPKNMADVSQVYYENNDENLKIHLTLNKGNIKKENISFYFSEPKPDLIITIGISDFKNYLSDKLNSFGFLLDSPVLNIDNNKENKIYGGANLVEEKALAEIIAGFLKTINEDAIKKNTADCLLAELLCFSDNLKKATPEALETAALLMKKGAEREEIAKKLGVQNTNQNQL